MLTGEFATEVSDASGMQLLDIPNRCWSDEVLSKLGIDPIETAVSISAQAKLSLNHFSDSPADWVTPITCQQLGTAQQKV